MGTGQEYYATHRFMENGRCWNCGIKPFYLSEFIKAFNEGNYSEKDLKAMSECHSKVTLGN